MSKKLFKMVVRKSFILLFMENKLRKIISFQDSYVYYVFKDSQQILLYIAQNYSYLYYTVDSGDIFVKNHTMLLFFTKYQQIMIEIFISYLNNIL